MKKAKAYLTPRDTSPILDLSGTGKTFRKQILPLTTITYKGRKIQFSREFLTDLANNFGKAYDQVPFVLADETNRHTMDPERFRGEVVGMHVTDTGLEADIKFPTKAAAKAVRDNPRLGVSARIVEGLARADGKTFNRAIQHVLGTMDPRVVGMTPWREVALSGYDDDIRTVDLTAAQYKENPMGRKKGNKGGTVEVDLSTLTAEDIAALDLSTLSDEQFLQLIDLAAEADGSESDESDEDETDEDEESDEDDSDDEDESDDDEADDDESGDADETRLSNELRRRVRRRANSGEQSDEIRQMREALAEQAWTAERTVLLSKGVPSVMIDLAAPVLASPDEVLIDLSNDGDDEPVNAKTVVRGILTEMQGLIDFKPSMGHQVDLSGSIDSEADGILEAWSAQFPNA